LRDSVHSLRLTRIGSIGVMRISGEVSIPGSLKRTRDYDPKSPAMPFMVWIIVARNWPRIIPFQASVSQ
jgi:hypothetical protein